MSCHGLGSWLHSEQIGCGWSLRKCFLGEQAKEGVHPQGRSWFGDASTSAAVHCCGVGVCNKVDTAPVSIRLARVCPDSNLGSKDKVAAIHTHTSSKRKACPRKCTRSALRERLSNPTHTHSSAPAQHRSHARQMVSSLMCALAQHCLHAFQLVAHRLNCTGSALQTK